MNFQNIFKDTFKYGVIMGIGFCVYTTLMWVTKLDTTYLSSGQYLDMAIIALPIIMIFGAIRQEIKKQKLNVLIRIMIAIYVGLISFLIYDPFLFVYHHYINPDWFSAVLQLKEAELIAAKTEATLIAEQVQQMNDSAVAQAGLFRLGALIPSVVIIPTLIALLSLIFIRTKSMETKG